MEGENENARSLKALSRALTANFTPSGEFRQTTKFINGLLDKKAAQFQVGDRE